MDHPSPTDGRLAPTSTSTECAPASPERRPDPHREWIGGQVAILLAEFYEPDRTDAFLEERDAMWMDVLEGFPKEVIRRAVVEYLRDGPRTEAGRLIRPSAGDIYAKARSVRIRLHPPPQAVPQIDPPRPPRTEEGQKAIAEALARLAGRRDMLTREPEGE